jgi:hypothetical protein
MLLSTTLRSLKCLGISKMTDSYNFEPDELLIETWPKRDGSKFLIHEPSKGIRITHLPTGVIEIATEGRNQFINREAALIALWNKVRHMPSYAELSVMFSIYRNAVENALKGEAFDSVGNRDDNGLLAGYQTRYAISELTTATTRVNTLLSKINSRN